MTQRFTRRTFVLAGTATASLMLLPPASGAAVKPKMVTYRSPSCGCCGKWIDAARAAGFDVAVVHSEDMHAIKAKHGIPDALASCHTSLIGGYVVEGHVPFAPVRRLLEEKPKIRGIAVAGMPMGTPGMEHGDHKQPFNVMAFDAAGRIRLFAKG